jgi:hypothetical protein
MLAYTLAMHANSGNINTTTQAFNVQAFNVHYLISTGIERIISALTEYFVTMKSPRNYLNTYLNMLL